MGHQNWRGGRVASFNIIPISIGAAKMNDLSIILVYGCCWEGSAIEKLIGMAFCIPSVDVSVFWIKAAIKPVAMSSYSEGVAWKKAEISLLSEKLMLLAGYFFQRNSKSENDMETLSASRMIMDSEHFEKIYIRSGIESGANP
ncbi:glyceraldehyde-3-phosphate dehydrogenase, cytosolic-like [Telopea speciosissima]|uniref:glyceraldehyde-3-phosphate dehydrogenase, cytosolic-like n=1 Tax=Telopea speciosissima TaxID=54955 RepID=UPI001CC772F2|nr:glyceraldehyde-3-phosphate dehydrogenase, cytosolic-like [Telopea speciosissima]